MLKHIKPLFDRVLVEKLAPTKQTAGGIVLPDSAASKLNEGRILAVGPGRRLNDGQVVPPVVNIGDHVMLSEYGGSDIKLNGKDCILVREDEILGLVEHK